MAILCRTMKSNWVEGRARVLFCPSPRTSFWETQLNVITISNIFLKCFRKEMTRDFSFLAELEISPWDIIWGFQ